MDAYFNKDFQAIINLNSKVRLYHYSLVDEDSKFMRLSDSLYIMGGRIMSILS